MPELREEIKTVLAQNDGIFTSKALQAMTKLDSFLKETLRVYPATMGELLSLFEPHAWNLVLTVTLPIASFQRKVLRTFTLSDGRTIPAGVTIEVPAVAISSDPEVFSDADEYDPLRFYKLREHAKASSKESGALNQFVSVSANSLNFGYGRHACPGRFFAANEIKMIFANALLKYDFKLPEGQTERYPNMEFAHMVSCDELEPRAVIVMSQILNVFIVYSRSGEADSA
jgi:hypothetical protein